MKLRIATFGLLLALTSQPMEARAQSVSEELSALKNKIAGCTRAKRKLRNFQKKYKDYHFVFAGRKDRTITGIRGCGYAWNKNRNTARKNAMRNCKKWEKKYGTDGGKKTCRFFKL